jgi:DsbC/DsbD-like thiol-disulfide interchange protein/cytochrome c biogenesis protein CcdA
MKPTALPERIPGMSKNLRRLLLSLFLAVPALEAASEPAHVKVDLLSETPAIRAGQPFTVAVRLRHDPQWHTYWKNPGDAGLATKIKWTLPPGFTAGPLQWPVPHKIGDETVLNYGYGDDTLLLTEITPPLIWTKNTGRVTLKTEVQWLECKDICLPGKGEASLLLPATDAPSPLDPAAAKIFAEARALLPLPRGMVRARAGLHQGRLWVGLPAGVGEMDFFPDDQNRFAAPKNRRMWKAGEETILSYEAGNLAGAGGQLSGVAVNPAGWRGPGSEQGVEVSVPLADAPPPSGSGPGLGFWTAILLAFAGGTILNLMPCVLPVLSIKILGFVNKAAGDPRAARRHGLLYAAGVMLSFWLLAGLLLAFRAGGRELGWGFQLQSPIVVGVLAALFVVLALNLFGLFEVGTSFTRLGGFFNEKSPWNDLGSGVLAVVVATPCTAPFMGAALGWAVVQPAPASLSIFTALGLGMAWPYALLTTSPRLLKFVPRPGPWMNGLKKVLGLLLLGTAAWLGTVLMAQMGNRPPSPDARWEPYVAARVQEERHAGRPVFVDFTAAWCLTCQVNERTTLKDASVSNEFKKRHVALFKGDWTNRDEKITQALAELGRNGVPVYVLYPADPAAPPRLLPALLTPGIVLDALTSLDQE